jgi:hypothetical protein
VHYDEAAAVRERLRVTGRRARRNAQVRQRDDEPILEVVLGGAREDARDGAREREARRAVRAGDDRRVRRC